MKRELDRRSFGKVAALLGVSAVLVLTGSAPVSGQYTNPDQGTPGRNLDQDPADVVRALYNRVRADLPADVVQMLDASGNSNLPGSDSQGVWDQYANGLRVTSAYDDSNFKPSHVTDTTVEQASGLTFSQVCGTSPDGRECNVLYASQGPLTLPSVQNSGN